MWSSPEHHSGRKFTRGRTTGAASPVRFRRSKEGGWSVTIGLSAIPVAYGPPNSVSEGMRIFREAEDRYWKRRKKL